MRRENVLDLLIELYGEVAVHGGSDEGLTKIRDRIHSEVYWCEKDAIRDHEEQKDALKRVKEAQQW